MSPAKKPTLQPHKLAAPPQIVPAANNHLEHWAATCTCGFTATTTLGSNSFSLNKSFVLQIMNDHITYMITKQQLASTAHTTRRY